MPIERGSIQATLTYKIPFFVLGVAIGMLAVWVAFQWVPGAMVAATAVTGG